MAATRADEPKHAQGAGPPRLMRVPERFKRAITRAGPEDAEDVARFRVEAFGPDSREADPSRNTWLYEENPFLDDAGPGIWICRKKGNIVGYVSQVPFELQVGHARRRAAWAIDLQVDDEWRLLGIGPGLIASQLQEHSITGVVNLSEHGYAAFRQFGWTDLGVVPVYVRPLDARRVLHAPGSPVPARLRRLAPLAGPGLRVVDAGLRASQRARGIRLVRTERLDDRVDEVWAKAAPHHPVLVRRDLHSLAWRIDARPDESTLTRYYLVRGDQTLGYAVLRPSVSDRLPVAIVVDYLAPPRWVAPLLLAAGWHARRDGAAALVVRTRNQPADRYLRAAGFIRRDSIADPPIRFMVSCEDQPEICSLVSDPDAWFITSSDSDIDHEALTAARPDPDSDPSSDATRR